MVECQTKELKKKIEVHKMCFSKMCFYDVRAFGISGGSESHLVLMSSMCWMPSAAPRVKLEMAAVNLLLSSEAHSSPDAQPRASETPESMIFVFPSAVPRDV